MKQLITVHRSLPKKPQLAMVSVSFMNYHLARLSALQTQLNDSCIGIELFGGYGDKDYYGLPFRDQRRSGLNIITLFPEDFHQVSFYQLTYRLLQTLQELSPGAIALCGYHRLENLVALLWAKIHHCPTILMIASKADDAPRQLLQEKLKGWIIRQFDGYLVGGIPQRHYMANLGAPRDRVFEGYDVVNNQLFASTAATARSHAPKLRRQLNLPDRYFIVASRFVPKKNLILLLQAYQRYRQITATPWSLVLCGSGPLEAQLQQFIATENLPEVYFPGFYPSEDLGNYYGLASCLIHPSIQEQWGLVVNEAMAAGLPILVSRTCGCVPNLLKEGSNGFSFDPTNLEELAQRMAQISQHSPETLAEMGSASQKLIAQYGPALFAENMLKALQASKPSPPIGPTSPLSSAES
jgi:1,2-diacylglycerol 3-alpha-glucosyltransferase